MLADLIKKLEDFTVAQALNLIRRTTTLQRQLT